MYLCEICATAFDAPIIRRTPNTDGEHTWYEADALCPVCGSENRFRHAVRCPKCGEWMRKGAVLCPACRADLRERFAAFVDELTPAEQIQLDNWLDGDTIERRALWV